MKHAVGAGQIVGWDDVERDPGLDAVQARMEARFGTERRNAAA